MGYFSALLDPRIAIAEAPLSGEPAEVMAEEAPGIANAAPRRRLEFAVGRACARAAMSALGHARAPLPRDQDRLPLWPDDLVGSITHTDTWAAAAVARREDGFASVGIDLEPASELEVGLWSSICRPEEQARLASIRGMTPGLAAHLAFCMKEAAFKCQFPLSRAMLEFADLEIDVDAAAGTFTATFRAPAPPFRADDQLAGRFILSDDHIASAVAIMTERTP